MSANFQITGSVVKLVDGKPEIILTLKVKDGYKVTYSHGGNTYSLNAGVSTITLDGFNDVSQQEISFTVTNTSNAVDTSEVSYIVNDDGSYSLTDNDDILNGGEGNDVIDGGRGSNALWGGAGNDIFVLLGGARKSSDYIADFEVGKDKIALADADDLASLPNIEESSPDGDSVHITYGTSSLEISGISASDLSADDFISYSEINQVIADFA